jgi:hypothetical protein
MPEGSNFENHETPPQPTEFLGRLKHDQETTPSKVDFESILEKGEIESVRELEGYWGMKLVEIKDGGDALFRPDKETDFIFEAKRMEARRSDLELMAYKVDQVLGFDLVPAVVNRTIGQHVGSLQRRIQNFSCVIWGTNWENRVRPEEITRAAIFDYLLDVRDRHVGNFIIDSDTGKLWLIDHDFFMFFDEIIKIKIIEKAQEKGLVILGGAERVSIERFLAHADSLTVDAKPEIVEIIKKARDRAEILLKKGQIPITNA